MKHKIGSIMGFKKVGKGPLDNRKKVTDDIQNSKQAIKHDAFDLEAFERTLKQSSTLSDNKRDGKKDYKQFGELLQDTFSALYKYNPKLLKDYMMNPEFLLNSEIMKQVFEAPKYKELRALTKLDDVNSTVGTEILSDELKELAKQMKEQKEALQELMDAMEGESQAQGAAGESDEDSDEEGGSLKGSERLTLEEAKKRLEEARKDFKDSVEKKEFKQGVHGVVSNAQNVTQETSDFIDAWGLGSDSSYSKRSFKEKMDLLHKLRNSPKLRMIAKLAGRYKKIAMQRQHQKIKRGTNEIYSIKQGKDLGKVLPSELMKLCDPVMETLFFKDYAEGKILQYETRSKAKQVKGPIVVAMDESYSMDGTPEIWAKAVAMGLLEIAISQKRDFAAIHFSGDTNPKKLHVDYFYKEEPYNIEKVLECVEYFDGGGTFFEAPLKRARQIISEHKKFTTADLVFITDGEAPIGDKFRDDFNKWIKDSKVSVYSILINQGSYSSTATLKEFTKPENIFKLTDLSQDDQDSLAINIFDSI
jgi:uncharacterized protein with von Willebrand factor type A (vWA) domain